MQLSIDVGSAETITRAFLESPAIVMDELETAMGSALLYLDREARERTPTAAGTLRQAWITDVRAIASLEAVFGTLSNPLPYALPVELGTKPHYPPIEPLINWVEQKLGLYGDEAEAAARGIQRKIGLVGTPGYGMAHLALAHGRSTIHGEFEEAAQRIAARMAAAGQA